MFKITQICFQVSLTKRLCRIRWGGGRGSNPTYSDNNDYMESVRVKYDMILILLLRMDCLWNLQSAQPCCRQYPKGSCRNGDHSQRYRAWPHMVKIACWPVWNPKNMLKIVGLLVFFACWWAFHPYQCKNKFLFRNNNILLWILNSFRNLIIISSVLEQYIHIRLLLLLL
jgi:hypothetical protein